MSKAANIHLLRAIHKADIKAVDAAIDKGADINATIENELPLQTAVILETNLAGQDNERSRAYTRIIELLLERGADVNVRDGDKYNVLHLAACGKSQNTEIIDLLIDKGADINALDQWGNTPLHHAASSGRNRVIYNLVDHGADITLTDMLGRTPKEVYMAEINNMFDNRHKNNHYGRVGESRRQSDQKGQGRG